jgi:hypothetical protein
MLRRTPSAIMLLQRTYHYVEAGCNFHAALDLMATAHDAPARAHIAAMNAVAAVSTGTPTPADVTAAIRHLQGQRLDLDAWLASLRDQSAPHSAEPLSAA